MLHVFTSHVSSETKHGQTAERSSMEAGQSPSFLRKQWKQFQGRCLSLKQSCKSHWADITLGIDLHTLSIIIIYDNDYHINMIMIIISYTFDYIYIYTVYIYIYTLSYVFQDCTPNLGGFQCPGHHAEFNARSVTLQRKLLEKNQGC